MNEPTPRDSASRAAADPRGADAVSLVQPPPGTWWGILRSLGPGLIIAGSIVGSGELIATTRTGALAGMSLLWLILLGCVIKVFCQVELGRYTISSGQTTLAALNSIPGPRWKANWIVWLWFAMMLASLGQLGAILGGVGQALAIAFPITGDYRAAITLPSEKEVRKFLRWQQDLARESEKLAALAPAERALRQEYLDRIRKGQQFLSAKLQGETIVGSGAEAEAARAALRQRSQEAIAAVSKVMAVEEGAKQRLAALAKQLDQRLDDAIRAPPEQAQAAIDQVLLLGGEIHQLERAAEAARRQAQAPLGGIFSPTTWDDRIWAVVIAAMTIGLLLRGRYKVVEATTTAMVVCFTFITIGNVFALQTHEAFAFSARDFVAGFGWPEAGESGANPLAMALVTFGIIGVGAAELVAYPYWCMEKGYARFTGPRSADASWAERARGWMKVMYCDAFVSMVVYTIATLAFYLLGAAVLHRQGLDPDGMRMIGTLAEQYRPVFGAYAVGLFLIGAFAVLYSTLLVATAGHARTLTDCFKVVGWMDPLNPRSHRNSVAACSTVLPLIALTIFGAGVNPVTLVMIGGFMQAMLLPVLGFASMYFRYAKTDERLRPSRLWDLFLLLSCIGMLITGLWNSVESLQELWKRLVG